MPTTIAKNSSSKDRVAPLKTSSESSNSSFSENGSHRNLFGMSVSARTSLPAYVKAVNALRHDDGWAKEIALGKRVGFYRLRGELGSGNFSQVKIAIHYLTKEKVAIKSLDKAKLDSKTQKMLRSEIAVMQQLCHPHIIQLFEVIDALSRVHLVLECAFGGELCTRITNDGKIPEQKSRHIFAQLVSAIDYMHSCNVIHRDIKAENVLFMDEDTIKVGDFGFSTSVRSLHEPLCTFCGSPPCAAPELFQDESYVGTAVDIWAMGVLLFFMVTGFMPFRAQTVLSLKNLIVKGEYHLPSHASRECSRLLAGMLRKNPTERFTMSHIVDSAWLAKSKTPDRSTRGRGRISQQKSLYHPWPRPIASERSRLEVETRHQMVALGITDKEINESVDRGCRDPVMGTFRILMHSNFNRTAQEGDGHSMTSETSGSESSTRSTNEATSCHKTKRNNKSRTCSVL